MIFTSRDIVACIIFGEYLRLAEVLVGKTGVPGVKTTAKGVTKSNETRIFKGINTL